VPIQTTDSKEKAAALTGEQSIPLVFRYQFNQPEARGKLSAISNWTCLSLGLTWLARLSAVALVLTTSVFFLISSFTFSWINIVKNDNVLWIAQLTDAYTALYWTALLLNAITLLPAFFERHARW
jgi:hypothetical protein